MRLLGSAAVLGLLLWACGSDERTSGSDEDASAASDAGLGTAGSAGSSVGGGGSVEDGGNQGGMLGVAGAGGAAGASGSGGGAGVAGAGVDAAVGGSNQGDASPGTDASLGNPPADASLGTDGGLGMDGGVGNTDAGGGGGPDATVDPNVPCTVITSGPSRASQSTSASFTLFCDDADFDYFECELDNGGFALCASLVNFSTLSAGQHTFRARALDQQGHVDGTPVEWTWQVTEGNWLDACSSSWGGCGVADDHTLHCWGRNGEGQLGSGSTGGSTGVPTQEATQRTDWAQVSCGGYFACAVTQGGELYCWGENYDGALGVGDTLGRSEPTQVGSDSDWRQVSAGGSQACAVKDGSTAAGKSLWCWGNDTTSGGPGALGLGPSAGDQSAPMQVGLDTDWEMVSSGSQDHSCAIKASGDLYCWGYNGGGQAGTCCSTKVVPTAVGGGSWVDMSAGNQYTCGIREQPGEGGMEQTLWCFGWNFVGQHGTNDTVRHDVPGAQESTLTTDWARVSAHGSHTCVTRADGTLWCMGSNYSGQLGLGTSGNYVYVPTQVGSDTNFAAPVLGSGAYNHTAALRTDGTLWSWGANSSGALAIGLATEVRAPVQEVTYGSSWTAVWAGPGAYQTCALRSGPSPAVWCWGGNWSGQLGTGDVIPSQLPINAAPLNSSSLAQMTLGEGHSCARYQGGQQLCVGENASGQLGNGFTPSLTWVPESTSGTWQALAAGVNHTLAIAIDGGLWAWGSNNTGQLGLGNAAPASVGTPAQVGTQTDWTAIAGGDQFSCGIRSGANGDGGAAAGLYCWGSNSNGQLGKGDEGGPYVTEPTSPIDIGVDFVDIAAGYEHACAIDSLGDVYCWGNNYAQQVGSDTGGLTVTTPTVVIGVANVIEIGLGDGFSCARSSGEQITCWGNNGDGAVGVGANENDMLPATLAESDWVDLAVGANHACGIREEGSCRTLWCWGSNYDGQVGVNASWRPAPALSLDP